MSEMSVPGDDFRGQVRQPPPVHQMPPERLQEILEAHELWVVTEGDEGERADLSGACLCGANLARAVLQGAFLTDADLRSADLSGAELQWAHLQGARLRKADLRRAQLSQADLSRADLQQAVMQYADLQQADLRFANLRDADLRGAQMQWAKLHEAAHPWNETGISPLQAPPIPRSPRGGMSLTRADLNGADLAAADDALGPMREGFAEGAVLAGANLKEAALSGADMVNVDFSRANLERADLRGAQLENANFRGAHLEEAELSGSNVLNIDLSEANLRGASLRGADLHGAKVQDADLRDTDLRDADLTGVTGLVARQLAGADVCGARLPEPTAHFGALGHVAEAARSAGVLFLVVLFGCLYAWLAIASTTDAALFAHPTPYQLPLINVPLPLARFYVAAPVILVAVFALFHLYLQRVWNGLAGLPAVFPDGMTLDQKVPSWLMSGIVRAHVARLRHDRPPLSWLQEWLSVLLGWYLVPYTLFMFYARYLPRHDMITTLLVHVVLLAASIFAGLMFSRLGIATLRGEGVPAASRKHPLGARFAPAYGALAAGAGIIFGLLAWASINYGIQFPVLPSFANLRDAEVSTRPANWTGTEFNLAKGALLPGVDLRWASGRRAFFVNADLRRADLRKAVFSQADFRKADLRFADLRQTRLRGANLQAATLERAHLAGAELAAANLSDAFLSRADLSGAGLRAASLKRAYLAGASLREADLQEADLRAALLADVDLSAANLRMATLADADLSGARLGGASLRGTDLQGAILHRADLTGADLYGARLQGADLTEAVGLTREQIDPAFVDRQTRLPDYLQVRRRRSRRR
ncbi:MAG TPA: pentapeptide repeat-containing protein [Armatimonadota bacterium]|nr:pentapeptide repeat-containing protein [Armatimonadota bacterium]